MQHFFFPEMCLLVLWPLLDNEFRAAVRESIAYSQVPCFLIKLRASWLLWEHVLCMQPCGTWDKLTMRILRTWCTPAVSYTSRAQWEIKKKYFHICIPLTLDWLLCWSYWQPAPPHSNIPSWSNWLKAKSLKGLYRIFFSKLYSETSTTSLWEKIIARF